ncbi:DUF6414 family protein [Vibrio crassostreae]|uniref:DUF6414 family protein n=1 Tax=Vibrio crassostreae TaxID=246167 RepID=UPI000F47427B|nr:hypothetical protein [Vibrio crassostreae]ROO49145.1 hypothetical protein EDB56_11367 [Vibrio crassostreae]
MIKNFIYLDEQKLYSFSSQLFEGVTEYSLKQHSIEEAEEDTQKGKFASGLAIASAVKEASSSTSKKFLHDYAFNLFEEEITRTGYLQDVSAVNPVSFDEICNSGKSFIRIRAKGKFVDTQEVQELMKHFNELGKAILNAQIADQYRKLEILKTQNKNSKAAKELQSQIDTHIRDNLAQAQLSMPKQVLEGLDLILNQFGDELIRFQQFCGEVEFSSLMERDYFKDSIKSVCKKYARKTAREFIVLGTISHSHDTQEVAISPIPTTASMTKHIIGLSETLYNFDQVFASKGEQEIIIEPIAIYTEI